MAPIIRLQGAESEWAKHTNASPSKSKDPGEAGIVQKTTETRGKSHLRGDRKFGIDDGTFAVGDPEETSYNNKKKITDWANSWSKWEIINYNTRYLYY